jgi:hypothetical protein
MSDSCAQRPVAWPIPLVASARQLWHRCLKSPVQTLARRLERARYRELWHRQLTNAEANALVFDLLSGARPFLVGRIGHTEGRILGEALFRDRYFGRTTHKQAHQNAGIFPLTAELLSEFAAIYDRSVSAVDLLGFWQTTYQARLLATHYPRIPLAPLSALEPYLQPSPWSSALQGRRVLVVHPFAESIMHQYTLNRALLFPGSEVLPEFELQVLLPPQTIAPLTAGYTTWIEAFEQLVERVLQREFDVALLGCGAYGLPLGAAIKAAGRQAIHLGGALQVLFGIRGRRWEQMPTIAAMMNEHWVRPSDLETPVSATRVEGGCYW